MRHQNGGQNAAKILTAVPWRTGFGQIAGYVMLRVVLGNWSFHNPFAVMVICRFLPKD